MRDFILLDSVGDYTKMVNLKDIKELLKENIKAYIKENAKEVDIENELDDLLMIDNCFNMTTIQRMLHQYGYEIVDLNDVRKSLNSISDYLYNNTQETDMFNRIEQVKNDIALLMSEFKKEV